MCSGISPKNGTPSRSASSRAPPWPKIGVTWLQAFHVREHAVTKGYGAEFDALRPNILGACDFCTTQRFKVYDDVSALGIPLLGGEGHHFNVSQLVAEGYQVVNY